MVKIDPHGTGGLLARILLLLGAVLFPLGLILPMIETQSFLIFKERYSLVQSIDALVQSRDYALAGVIALFSILFPTAKFATLAWLNLGPRPMMSASALKLLEMLGKWSMMDVFVLALIVVSLSSNGLARALTQPGLYAFAVSALMFMLASGLIARDLEHPAPLDPEPPLA
ncbi:paraquat-inducible protein A [Woodsholea maritima]|uniref:paraquat-inducible protein A n=1 Tax=Woodsholea maritima TaxID=240237 RepID=UPI00037EA434|nr:paraquat-inducible protein A [Woodsholea maritima]